MENKDKHTTEEKKYYIMNILTGEDEEVTYEEWKKFNDVIKDVWNSSNNFIKHE